MNKFLCSFFTLLLGTLSLHAQTGASDTDRQSFVDEINRFRAEKNLPPLEQWVDGEACADKSAEQDAREGAHASMNSPSTSSPESCFYGANAWAQNTIPGNHNSLEASLPEIKKMWDEQYIQNPGQWGDIHYKNMIDPRYNKVAVGVYQMENGNYWINMNFRN